MRMDSHIQTRYERLREAFGQVKIMPLCWQYHKAGRSGYAEERKHSESREHNSIVTVEGSRAVPEETTLDCVLCELCFERRKKKALCTPFGT